MLNFTLKAYLVQSQEKNDLLKVHNDELISDLSNVHELVEVFQGQNKNQIAVEEANKSLLETIETKNQLLQKMQNSLDSLKPSAMDSIVEDTDVRKNGELQRQHNVVHDRDCIVRDFDYIMYFENVTRLSRLIKPSAIVILRLFSYFIFYIIWY